MRNFIFHAGELLLDKAESLLAQEQTDWRHGASTNASHGRAARADHWADGRSLLPAATSGSDRPPVIRNVLGMLAVMGYSRY